MSNFVPIQITLQAATAADAKQLVQDLASTMSGMADVRIPARTEVSTVEEAPVTATVDPSQQAPAQYAPPATPPAYPQPPQQGNAVPTVPVAPPQPTSSQQPAATVPTSAPTYDLTQLGVAAQPLMDAGRQNEIIAWLHQRGVQALTQLDPSQYGEFATFLRSLGAKI